MNWFEKILPPKIKYAKGGNKRGIPEGLWTKCSACGAVLYRVELERNLHVCPKCTHHARISARQRLDYFLDKQPREEIGAELRPVDVLRFKDSRKYRERLSEAQKATGQNDALLVIKCALSRPHLFTPALSVPCLVLPPLSPHTVCTRASLLSIQSPTGSWS